MQNVMPDGVASYLTRVPDRFATPEDAWRCCIEVYVATDAAIAAPIEMIGTFVVPPPRRTGKP